MPFITSSTWKQRDKHGHDFAPAMLSNVDGFPAVSLSSWGEHIQISDSLARRVNMQSVERGHEWLLGDYKLRMTRQTQLAFPSGTIWTPENGLLQVDLFLDRRPPANRNRFPLTLHLPAGSQMLYQPDLTEEEVKDGSFRPDWAVHSYALYSNDGRKLAHFPRPFAVDRNGAWTWGKWEFDAASGTLAKVFDPAWLQKAAYPVRMDDTFGYTSVGASSAAATQNYQIAYGNWQPSADGTVTDLYVYCYWAAGIKFGLFENASAATVPDTVAYNGGVYGGAGTSGWHGYTGLSVSVLAARYYWMASLSASGHTEYYDTGAASGMGRWWDTQTYADGFTTWDASTIKNNNRYYSAYAVYAPLSTAKPRIIGGGIL